jgi:hypothetical protein
MKNINILTLIYKSFYLNELSKFKADLKCKRLMMPLIKTDLGLKESFTNDIGLYQQKRNEALIFYNHAKMQEIKTETFNKCFMSYAIVDSKQLLLGSYFKFVIYRYHIDNDSLKKIIAFDVEDHNDDRDLSEYKFTSDRFKVGYEVQERTGNVERMIIMPKNKVAAYDSINNSIFICDYKKKTVLSIVRDFNNKAVLFTAGLNGYYYNGSIFDLSNDKKYSIKSANWKLSVCQAYLLNNSIIVFINKSRIYIYSIDHEKGGFFKMFKKDHPNIITTGIVSYREDKFLFGNVKGELVTCSYIDKNYIEKKNNHYCKIDNILSSQNKMFMSSDSSGKIKIYDYYTLYLRSTISISSPISLLILLPDQSDLFVFSTYKGELQKVDYTYPYRDKPEETTKFKEEYYSYSELRKWALREREIYATGFLHRKPIIKFIKLSSDRYVTTDGEYLYIWHRKRLSSTIQFSGPIESLRKEADNLIGFYSDGHTYFYRYDKCLIKIPQKNSEDDVKYAGQYYLIKTAEEISIYDIKTNEKLRGVRLTDVEAFEYYDKKLIYVTFSELVVLNLETGDTKIIISNGRHLNINLRKGSRIGFENRRQFYELNVNTMEVSEIENI